MALFTLGATITDARGSVGGTVFSRNKGGAYGRARVAPINRNTPAQTAVRNNFGLNTKLWSSSLTADQRAAWTAFAAANPMINRLGASIVISGIAMFMKLTQVLTQLGTAYNANPPADLSVPAVAAPTGATAVAATPAITIQTAVQAVVTDASYYIFATGPLAPGKTPGTSDYRFLAAVQPVAMAAAVDVTSAWVALFGTLAINQSIGFSVATANTSTGATTSGQSFNIIST
jgi:hypothetical protein